MSRSSRFETWLFWVMLLVGTSVLAPCLILPPWLEYQAQLERRQAAVAARAAQQRRLQATQKQIEHLRTDPAYVLRLAEQDFGHNINLSQVETVRIDPSPPPQDPAATTPTAGPADDELLPELSTFVDQTLDRYPHTRLFVHGATRPILMAMGGAMLLAAVVLLGTPSHRRAARPESTHDH